MIRGNVDALMKLTSALDSVGIEFISDAAISQSDGRGGD
jgi:hypothetical protein